MRADDCRLPIADCRLPISDLGLNAADGSLSTAECPLPTVDCTLPTPYTPLPTPRRYRALLNPTTSRTAAYAMHAATISLMPIGARNRGIENPPKNISRPPAVIAKKARQRG